MGLSEWGILSWYFPWSRFSWGPASKLSLQIWIKTLHFLWGTCRRRGPPLSLWMAGRFLRPTPSQTAEGQANIHEGCSELVRWQWAKLPMLERKEAPKGAFPDFSFIHTPCSYLSRCHLGLGSKYQGPYQFSWTFSVVRTSISLFLD